MARLTISEIMTQVASTVNQEATAPTAGGAEYNLWLQYINRSIQEWGEANDWEAMRQRFYPTISGMSLATVSLPADFKKLAAETRLYNGTISTGEVYPDIMPEQSGLYASTDKYVEVIGNISDGYSLLFHPSTLGSGASLAIQYFAMPTSLASPAQYIPLDDPQFVVDRTIAYIFEARSDARFQVQENKARERLLAMVENANLSKFNSYANPNFVTNPERKQGFRIGRD